MKSPKALMLKASLARVPFIADVFHDTERGELCVVVSDGFWRNGLSKNVPTFFSGMRVVLADRNSERHTELRRIRNGERAI